MLITHLLSRRESQVHLALGASIMLLAYPILQSFGNPLLWMQVAEPATLLFYVLFSVLFGLVVMTQVYWLRLRTCRTGAATGAVSVLAGLVGHCPACLLLLSFFLPFNAIVALSASSIWLSLGSIALMIISLRLLGAFGSDSCCRER